MALTLSQVGRRTVFGDRRVHFFDVVFSGTYPDGGEPITPASFGLTRIDYIAPQVGPATDRETAVIVSWDQVASTLLNFECAATGLPLLEKTDSEAYITGQSARLMVIGV